MTRSMRCPILNSTERVGLTRFRNAKKSPPNGGINDGIRPRIKRPLEDCQVSAD